MYITKNKDAQRRLKLVTEKYIVGIDGGGTRCRAALYSADGQCLGRGNGGPANIMSDAKQALDSAVEATRHAISSSNLSLSLREISMAAGFAGANIPHAKQAFLAMPTPFKKTTVISDLHAACVGAHNGRSGALIICGTGSSATTFFQGKFTDKGGYGAMLGDNASGAWLGLAAVRHALLALDDITPSSDLSQRVCAYFNVSSGAQLIAVAIDKPPSFFGRLAPTVALAYQGGCEIATELVQQGADYLSRLAHTLLENEPSMKWCLVGGLAELYQPLMASSLSSQRVCPQYEAEYGAFLYAKNKGEA